MSCPVANHPRLGLSHGSQALECHSRFRLLNESDDRVDEHHREDHGGVDVLAERGGDDACNEQHVDQRVVELLEHPSYNPGPLRRRQDVRPETSEASFRLGCGQAVFRISVDRRHHIGYRHGVGGEYRLGRAIGRSNLGSRLGSDLPQRPTHDDGVTAGPDSLAERSRSRRARAASSLSVAQRGSSVRRPPSLAQRSR